MRRILSPFFVLACALVPSSVVAQDSASAAAVAPASVASAGAGGAVLQPGDVVRIAVWRKPEMSGEFVVGADSALKHPLYQEVKVAGVPIAVAQQRMREYLARYETDPQFTMEPLFRVAVAGEVKTPNLYSLPRETTVAQAIALAGGPTERGRLDRVRLVRDDRQQTIDLTRADATWAHEPIRSGDAIVVPRRRDLLRDFLAPISSVVAVVVSIVAVVRR